MALSVARLDGAIALVTGVGPGMGRSVALALAGAGADVALGARTLSRCESVAAEVEALGRRAVALGVDLGDAASCEAFVDGAAAALGPATILVQNGHHPGDWTPAADADLGSWRQVFDVNLFGALALVRAAVPAMRARGGGAVVLVNSGAAVRAPLTMGAYSASKAALASLTRTLANELGADGIRVNGIYLGPVDGDNLTGSARAVAAAQGITLEAWMASKAAELPLRRIPTPDDCAPSVLFLASDMARAVTGQNIAVNGGQWTTA